MQFIKDGGPDIPDELITAQERGETLFVCGAGVSRTEGLPLFRGLVEGVYTRLGEDWTLHTAERAGMEKDGKLSGQYDRVLRCLERRLASGPRNRGMRERIRSAVRQELAAPDGATLDNHAALLQLSRDSEGNTRLLTTNFDTLFERAWLKAHQRSIPSHAGAAMPAPRVADCQGVLHLHGRIADSKPELRLPDTDLVLNSAEFGDAYLRTGWASRYVYDAARAYQLVLIGYQADDPPMRYLLEALEADRERFPDLRRVYAFAPYTEDVREVEAALWGAKGVEPILYHANGEDHSSLYASIREWHSYAADPTAWRRRRLESIVKEDASKVERARVDECVPLLSHGDVSQVLGDLSPAPAWLSALNKLNLFTQITPGAWIASRIDDPEMIRACATLRHLSDDARWHINRALQEKKSTLTPIRMKAWQLLLASKRQSPESLLDDNWYFVAQRIKEGQADFDDRRLVSRLLRPTLEIDKPMRAMRGVAKAEESLHELVSCDFECKRDVSPGEIVGSWPKDLDQLLALLRVLDRALTDSLEEAFDLGLADAASYDAPSVALHAQNEYRSGFYPIVRVIADLWLLVAGKDKDRARSIAANWATSPFSLQRRLWLFALADGIYEANEAFAAARDMDDRLFWDSHAQVELMRLLTSRWKAAEEPLRHVIEAKICIGIPRSIFPEGAFEEEEEWVSVRDSSTYRRLHRIAGVGIGLSAQATTTLIEIARRHPKWEPGPDDRDDFSVWHGSSTGPTGRADMLDQVSDGRLVREAMRMQKERRFDAADVWRVLCSADPERALRALRLESEQGIWEGDAWQGLLWEAGEKVSAEFSIELGDLLFQMPDASLNPLLQSAAGWLEKHRKDLSGNIPGGPRFFRMWDRLVGLSLDNQTEAGERDALGESLGHPIGISAQVLLYELRGRKPAVGSGLPTDVRARLERLVQATGPKAVLGRVVLMRDLAMLEFVDPLWVEVNMLPLLLAKSDEADVLWRAQAHDHSGSHRLFNALKRELISRLQTSTFSDDEAQSLFVRLLSIGIWQKRGDGKEFDLKSAEIKRVLTVGPPAIRENASWNLWRIMGKADEGPEDQPTRWRTIVGPLFREIWPLDAKLRAPNVSRNLVLMCLECGDAFPDAVDATADLLVPYQLYRVSHSLRLEKAHESRLKEHPAAFVRLLSAIVDPSVHPAPNDLGAVLAECVAADASVQEEPAYVRLYGFRRLVNA